MFDIPLLAQRVTQAINCLSLRSRQPLGLFGASIAAGAALAAAALRAVVSRSGRPDLAGDALRDVLAPTLLVVGGDDSEVLAMKRAALARMHCEKQLEIVPRASHLFEEVGALDAGAALADALGSPPPCPCPFPDSSSAP